MNDAPLTDDDFTESTEPFRLFARWLEDATKSELNDPNGVALATCTLFRYGWLELEFRLAEPVTAKNGELFELEISADQSWQPRPGDRQSRDDRQLSVAVCNLRYS